MKVLKKIGRALLTVLVILGAVVGLGWLWRKRGAASGGGEVAAAEPRAESLKAQMDDAIQRADTARDLRVEAEQATAAVDAKIEAVETKLPPPTPQGVADAFNKRDRGRRRNG